MRIVRDENGFKLIDYLPEDIGAVSTETFTDFQQLVIQRIDTIINHTIDLEFLEMVVANSINNRLKVGFIVEFEVNAAGDLIYRGTDEKPNRLPIGDNGEVLTVINGLPSWEPTSKTVVETITEALTQGINNRIYVCKGTSRTDLVLPLTAEVGDRLQLIGAGSGGWLLSQNTGQRIHFGDKSTILSTGTIESTHAFDGMTLMCTTENTVWHVINSNGNPWISE